MAKARAKTAKKSTKRTTGKKVAVGDRVEFRLAGRRVSGKVVEDRGKLGAGGRRIVSIRAKIGRKESSLVELPADEVRRRGSAG